jgi:hypothetical protein
MAKPSDTHLPEIVSSSTTIAKEIPSQHVSAVTNFLRNMGVSDPVPDNCNTKDFYSDLVRGFLKPDRVLRGRVTCILTIKPPVAVTLGTPLCLIFYGSLTVLHLFCFWWLSLKFDLFLFSDLRTKMF